MLNNKMNIQRVVPPAMVMPDHVLTAAGTLTSTYNCDTMTRDSAQNTHNTPRRLLSRQHMGIVAMALLIGLFQIIVSPLQAQKPVDSTRLSLKQALTFALKANQDARKARLDIENSEYRIDEVKAGALPKVNGSAGLTYNPILQLSALPGDLVGQPGTTLLVPFGQKWSGNAGVSVSQAIYDQSVLTGLKAARSTREYYAINAQLTEEQLIEQVATNYYQVLVQQQKLAVLDTTIANSIRVSEIIAEQHRNGLAKKIDVDRIKVNISNLKSQRQQLINAVSQSGNLLKYAMGMAIETPLALEKPDFDETPTIKDVPGTIDVTDRSEFRLLSKQEQLLTLQKTADKAAYYPSLALSGNYSYQGLGNSFPVFKGATQGINWFDVASVGVTLKVPIFNGNATRSRVKQADVEIRKLQEDIRKTKLSLDLAYQNAKAQIDNSLIVLATQQENVQLAGQVFQNTKNNYNNGLAPLTDLLDAETSFTEAQNSFATALLDYKLAEIQLVKAQGKLKSLIN